MTEPKFRLPVMITYLVHRLLRLGPEFLWERRVGGPRHRGTWDYEFRYPARHYWCCILRRRLPS